MDEKAYRKLECWRRGMDLAISVFEVTKKLPADQKFGLVSQMQRAAVSIPANIAEGYGRSHRGDYVRFLSIARGSLMELETHVILCVRCGLLNREETIPVWLLCQEVGKMLTALIRSLVPQISNYPADSNSASD